MLGQICQNNCHVVATKYKRKIESFFNEKSCYKIKLSLKNYVTIVKLGFLNADCGINRPILFVKFRHLQKFC